MKQFFKQLFCRHIWQEVARTPNGSIRVVTSVAGCVDIDRYFKYILTRRCVKCEKEKVQEIHELVI